MFLRHSHIANESAIDINFVKFLIHSTAFKKKLFSVTLKKKKE